MSEPAETVGIPAQETGEQTQEFAYIGRGACGCLIAAAVDYGDKRTAANVAEFIEDGLIIERVTLEFVRANPWGCKCAVPQQEAMAI